MVCIFNLQCFLVVFPLIHFPFVSFELVSILLQFELLIHHRSKNSAARTNLILSLFFFFLFFFFTFFFLVPLASEKYEAAHKVLCALSGCRRPKESGKTSPQ